MQMVCVINTQVNSSVCFSISRGNLLINDIIQNVDCDNNGIMTMIL